MAILLDYPAPDYGPSRQQAWLNKPLKDDSGKTVQVRSGRSVPLQRIKLAWAARTGASLAAFSTALRSLRGGFVDAYFYTPSLWEWWADVAAGTGDGTTLAFSFGGRSAQATPAPIVKVGGTVQTGNYALSASGDSLARDQVVFAPISTFTDLGTVMVGVGSLRHLVDLGAGVVLAATYGGLHAIKSIDHGLTWTDLGAVLSMSDPKCMLSLGSGVVLFGNESPDGVYRSTNSGAAWTGMAIQTQLGYEVDVSSLAFAGSGVVIAGGYRPSGTPGGKLLRSTDSGVTWADLSIAAAETKITALVSVGGGIVLAGSDTDGRILRSTDSGATWTNLGTACVGEVQVSSFASLGSGIVVAGTNLHAHILRSTDSGATWTDLGMQVPSGEHGDIPSIASLGSGVVIAALNNSSHATGRILLSQDFGATWTDLGQQFSQSIITSVSSSGTGIGLATTEPDGKMLRLVVGPVGAITVSFLGRRLLLGRLTADDGPWGTPAYQQGTLSVELEGEEV